MTTQPKGSLKLQVKTTKDLELLSVYLQDALVSVGALLHSPDSKGFSLFVNRFKWEEEPLMTPEGSFHARTHAGVHFSNVRHVQHKNIDHAQPDHFLNVLSCHGDVSGEIHLVFSQNKEICLHVDDVSCHLMDMDEPWYTPHKPLHVA